MKVNAKHFASFKLDAAKSNSRYFEIAEVTVFERTVFKTQSIQVQSGKFALQKLAIIVLSCRKWGKGEILALKNLVREVGHISRQSQYSVISKLNWEFSFHSYFVARIS